MTREEKISHLKDILSEINENDNAVCYLTSEDNELIESAIEALSQEPCYNPDEWCHDCSEYNHDKHCCPRYNKVIRNTVEEMKQPCEDKIIEWKKDFKEYVNSLSIPRDDYKGIMEYIDELPITPKPKVGHWIYEKRKRLINETDEGAEYVTDYWCKCSKCGGDFGYRKMKDAFCKYCGAKMIEPQESEE